MGFYSMIHPTLPLHMAGVKVGGGEERKVCLFDRDGHWC